MMIYLYRPKHAAKKGLMICWRKSERGHHGIPKFILVLIIMFFVATCATMGAMSLGKDMPTEKPKTAAINPRRNPRTDILREEARAIKMMTGVDEEAQSERELATFPEEEENDEESQEMRRRAERIMLERQATEANGRPVIMVEPIEYTEEDLLYVAKIIEREAGSAWLSNHHQLMVGNVLINRLQSSEYPDTLAEIIDQPRAYLPIDSEEFAEIYPSDRAFRNAEFILKGVRVCPPAVIFQANFRQGTSDFEVIKDEILGPSYFCYANNMECYEDPGVFIAAMLEKSQ